MNQTVNKNTPKGIGADGVAEVPSAYLVRKLECVNQNGATIDISALVQSFTITEELFSPIVVMNLRIRDNINFFEDFSLNGQEQINVQLDHLPKGKEARRISLTFAVKEYPNYQKTASEPNIQEYNIVAVSPFGYESMLTRISRSVKGNPLDGITKIFNTDLSVPTKINGTCVSVFDGIITIQSPLKAVEWLRSKSFDVSGSPFFIYSNISAKNVLISSLSDIWSSSNKSIRTYHYRQFLASDAQSPEAYEENATRILGMQSNIKLDKLSQATRGGFASKTSLTDVATKTFSETVFNYSNDEVVKKNRVSLKEVFSPNKTFSFGTSPKKSLGDLADASISNVSTNSSANYGGNPNSSSGPVQDNISRAKSYYANLDAVSHQIQVYGDFNLNPGKRITIKIPKSIDASQDNTRDQPLDLSMSGDYIVGVVAHSFSGGIYTAKAKIIKDS